MFREMRRGKQALQKKACEEVLKRGTAGVLAVAGDDGYPYAVPLSYVYDAEHSALYFHSALSGHKMDALKRNGKASFCVVDKDSVVPKQYTTYFRSVIVFGTVHILEDAQEKYYAIEALAKKYAPDDSREGRDKVIGDGSRFCMLELQIAHMTGKEARELIGHKLSAAVDKWKLEEVSCLYEKETRAVYSAYTKEWGSVIVKINEDKKELKSGYEMLRALNGTGCCQAYAFDAGDGTAVFEQIFPGNTLREEQDPQKRAAVFCEVFQKIHGAELSSGHDTYMDWLERAKRYCKDGGAAVDVREKMQRAYQIGKEMFEKYPERVLLHGDLHHDNILLGRRGYCMIDPKGVIAPEIFDIPRFLLNEFGYVSEEKTKTHIKMMSGLLAQRTGYEEADMEKLLFMEGMLDVVWCMEDGEDTAELLNRLRCFC